jgi:hypothetical protein
MKNRALKLGKKIDWCSEKEVDPFQISVQQLADFLIFLFEEKGLSPSTIKGYCSAISRTIYSGGPDFGSDEFISLLQIQTRNSKMELKTLCLGRSRLKFVTSKEINSSLPKSGPPE